MRRKINHEAGSLKKALRLTESDFDKSFELSNRMYEAFKKEKMSETVVELEKIIKNQDSFYLALAIKMLTMSM